MSINSIEGLQSKLTKDLSWRKKEIIGFRMSATRSGGGREYLYRAGLVMMCAPWEGFLRRAVQLYVDHVFSQKLRVKELSPVFVSLAYFSDVRRAGDANYPGSLDTHVRLAKRIKLGIDEICDTAGWVVKTEGSPSTEVMTRLLTSVGLDDRLGFDVAAWSTTKVFIDEQVVRDRHRVAHGEAFPVTREQFLERTSRLMDLLEKLNLQLIVAAESKSYSAK